MRKFLNLLLNLISAAILTVAALYGLWLGIRAFAFDTFIIPTDSMQPTLRPGDRVGVNKLLMGARIYSDFNFNPKGGELKCWRTKGLRAVERGDVVVFNFPHHEWRVSFIINNVYCKRVVALPGDTLRTVEGYYRNNHHRGTLGCENGQRQLAAMTDSMVAPASLRTIPFDDHFPWTIRNFGPLYIPRKGDTMRLTPMMARLYQILLEWEMGAKVEYNFEDNVVSADGRRVTAHTWQHNYYFMAGDNVTNSYDSRYWGLVPEEYIVGIVNYAKHDDGTIEQL